MSGERLAEIKARADAAPEWTGGPDWAFHALEDRKLLLDEVERLKQQLAGKVPVVVVSEDVWRELGQPQTLSEVISRLGEGESATQCQNNCYPDISEHTHAV